MNAAALLDMIQSPDIRIERHVVVVNDEPQGILLPSAAIACNGAPGRVLIRGPRRMLEADAADAEAIWGAMISCGAILFGTPPDVACVDALLADPVQRRVAAWMCDFASDCRVVVDALARVRAASVVVLGAGSVGSLVAMTLACAGVGSLRVVDRARVEAAGLDRELLYAPADIGRDKAHVLRGLVAARNPSLRITALTADIDAAGLHGLLDGTDVLVLAIGRRFAWAAQARAMAARRGAHVETCGVAADDPEGEAAPHGCVAHPLDWMRLPQAISERNAAATLTLAGQASSAVLARLCGVDGRAGAA
jgi:hypothetical protein